MTDLGSTRAARLPAALLLALLLAAGPVLLSARPALAARTFVVTTVGDEPDRNLADDRCDASGTAGDQCTLRAALQEANTTPGADTINFNIAGAGVKTIRPRAELPVSNEQVTINGYSQPGAKFNTAAVGTNAVLRIALDGSDERTQTSGLRINGRNSVVRGLAITRFSRSGISVDRDGAGVRILGCFLGTDASGGGQGGNGIGVTVAGVDATIGGAAPAARNLISGNDWDGVHLTDGARGARVLGNLIGTTKVGNAPLPNANNGISSDANDTHIGGTTAEEANVIRFNGGDGVALVVASQEFDPPAFPITRNRILRNVIADNDNLGIDLNSDGVSPNDPNDPDGGGNNTQNFPVIVAATSTEVQVTLNSRPNETYVIRLFSNPAGGTEGRYFHGAFGVTTDNAGNAGPVTLNPTPPIPTGRTVTTTATRQNGDTSEFSAAVPVA